MAVIRRGERTYVYRSVWRDGRTTSTYVGAGDLAIAADWLESRYRERARARRRQAREDTPRRRADARARRRAERLAARADFERRAAEAAPWAAWCARADRIFQAAMVWNGWHQHKRTWRRRRMTTPATIESKFAAALGAEFSRRRDIERAI